MLNIYNFTVIIYISKIIIICIALKILGNLQTSNKKRNHPDDCVTEIGKLTIIPEN